MTMSASLDHHLSLFDVVALRREFPILQHAQAGKPLAFLDSAASSQKPRRVIDAHADFYRQTNANVHRGVYRLSEEATFAFERARGKLARFIGSGADKPLLELQGWKPGEPYWVGLFLAGAYQEVMGSFHNLFGIPNEAQVAIGPDGRAHVAKIIPGSRVGDMLSFARFDHRQVAESFQSQVAARVSQGALTAAAAEQVVAEYTAALQGTTYLE